jgi:hypothetical protein
LEKVFDRILFNIVSGNFELTDNWLAKKDEQ